MKRLKISWWNTRQWKHIRVLTSSLCGPLAALNSAIKISGLVYKSNALGRISPWMRDSMQYCDNDTMIQTIFRSDYLLLYYIHITYLTESWSILHMYMIVLVITGSLTLSIWYLKAEIHGKSSSTSFIINEEPTEYLVTKVKVNIGKNLFKAA